MRTACLPAFLIAFLASTSLPAAKHYTLTGKVVSIADGDTLTVLDDAKVQPVAPAIGNAIFQATGVRLRTLPMAPKGLKV